MEKVKRFLALCGMGVLALALCACSMKNGKSNGIAISALDDSETVDLGPDLTGEDFSEYRVGVSLSDCTSNTYSKSYVQALNEAMSDYGVDTTVFDAFGDAGQQAAQIRTLLTMNVNLIILWPSNSDDAVNWVKTIHEAGIPVLTANTNVSTDGEEYIEGFVGPNGADEAALTAEQMITDLESSGNIVILNGKENYAPAAERIKGLKDTISGTRINVIEEYSNAHERSVSKTYMTECLKNHSIGEIDAVFCYDDEAALGALDAMSAMNRTGEIKVYIAALGYYDTISYIEDGSVSAATVQSPIVDARTTVNYALNLLKGNPLPEFHTYISTPLVTSENVDALGLTPWNE